MIGKKLVLLSLFAAVFVSGFILGSANGQLPWTATSAQAQAQMRVFELRTYTSHEGRLQDVFDPPFAARRCKIALHAIVLVAIPIGVFAKEQLTLSFDAKNLSGELARQYVERKDMPAAIYNNGRQFYLGLKYSM